MELGAATVVGAEEEGKGADEEEELDAALAVVGDFEQEWREGAAFGGVDDEDAQDGKAAEGVEVTEVPVRRFGCGRRRNRSHGGIHPVEDRRGWGVGQCGVRRCGGGWDAG